MTTDNNLAAPSFDRMRNMLVRAAEVRESEQQQIFDALDDIYARLAPLDALGAVRKRMSELPDRTEVGVLAERLDEAMSRLEAQDNAIAAVSRSIEAIVDKLAKPFGQLDGRLDGMAGKFEGVAGRMDGLEDKLQNIHRRLDELDGSLDKHLDKQDDKLEAIPGSVTEPMRERVDSLEGEVRTRIDELDATTRERIDAGTESVRTAIGETSERVDSSERLQALDNRIEAVAGTLGQLGDRLDKLEEGISTRIGDVDGSVSSGLAKVEGTLANRPDTDAVTSVVRTSNEESERRIGGQLDEAMATFAELMLGGGQSPQPVPAAPAPRQPRRSNSSRNGRASKNGTESKSTSKSSGSTESGGGEESGEASS